MKKITLGAIAILLGGLTYFALSSFCGLYVAKADMKLFNKASQVILARDGDWTSLTMSNDFQGEVKDFAMVIPVPQVLRRDQIRVLDDASIFQKLDDYSAPRLVEYYDENPCNTFSGLGALTFQWGFTYMVNANATSVEPTVKVEASYTIGEYDIVLLSATESSGLKTWLNENGYKIPAEAEEVLEPYINSNMKFFVAKVNLDKFDPNGFQTLRPIQISFNSPKFMLPIRLGMANSTGFQDLIVYAFSKTGIVEPVNYRLSKPPNDRNLPEFIQNNFGVFYKAVFDRAWQNDPYAVYLEYAWDLDSKSYFPCDPCPTEPPIYSELHDAGVFWIKYNGGNFYKYEGNVFITRLHVRYNRENFPQDLVFQATPRKENIQLRYIVNHPTSVDTSNCKEAIAYLQKLPGRRRQELREFNQLTGLTKQQFLLMAPKAMAAAYTVIDTREDPLKWAEAIGQGNYKEAEVPDELSPSSGPSAQSWLVAFLVVGLVGLGLYASRRTS